MKAAFNPSHHFDKPPVLTLLYVLHKTLIRHTKRQVIAGVQVLDLPPKTEETVPGELKGGACACLCICGKHRADAPALGHLLGLPQLE